MFAERSRQRGYEHPDEASRKRLNSGNRSENDKQATPVKPPGPYAICRMFPPSVTLRTHQEELFKIGSGNPQIRCHAILTPAARAEYALPQPHTEGGSRRDFLGTYAELGA